MIPFYQFVATSPDDIPPTTDCLWDRDFLSHEASDIGRCLAEMACPVNGEAITYLECLAKAAGCDLDRAALALMELKEAGIITFCVGHGVEGGLVYCIFDIDSDVYYGDDGNPPPDISEDIADASLEYLADTLSAELRANRDAEQRDPDAKRHRIFSKTNYRCFYCVEARATQIDHMHPRIRGGSNDDDNLIGACMPCNVRKKDRTVEEYRFYLQHRHRVKPGYRIVFYGEREKLH